MYEVVMGTPKEVFIIYFIVLIACFTMYPIAMMLMNAVYEQGTKQ
jgi:hypothetical protein